MMRIAPISVYSNFAGKNIQTKRYKEDNYEVMQERKNGVLVYERKEYKDKNYRHTLIKEYTDYGKLKVIYEEKVKTFDVQKGLGYENFTGKQLKL